MNLFRFVAVTIGLFILLPLLALLVQKLTDVDITSAAFAVVPLMLAALIEGQYLAREQGRVPTGAEKQRLTGIGAALATLIYAGVLIGLPQVSQQALDLPQGSVGLGLTLGLIAILTLIAAGAVWFFYGFGAKTELKAIEKRANRKG